MARTGGRGLLRVRMGTIARRAASAQTPPLATAVTTRLSDFHDVPLAPTSAGRHKRAAPGTSGVGRSMLLNIGFGLT